jgi:hypothetical protein
MFERSGRHVHNNIHVFRQPVITEKGIIGAGDISPIWKAAPDLALCDPNHAFGIFDDFLGYITTQNGWTTAGTGPTVACNEALPGGVLLLTSSGTDNQAAIAGRTYEEFSVETGKKLYFEARVMPAELNTDDVNIFVGMTQGTLADAVPLTDDGAGIADDDHIGFSKYDGGTVWNCVSGDGAAAFEATAVNTRVVDTWVRLGFIADPTQIDFYIDGNLVATHTTTLPTAGEEMTACIVVKCGSANAETLQADWIKIIQER